MSDFTKLHRLERVPELNGASTKARAVWSLAHHALDRRGRMILGGADWRATLVRRLGIDPGERQWFHAGLKELEKLGLASVEGDEFVLGGHAGDDAPKPRKPKKGSTPTPDLPPTYTRPTPDLPPTYTRPTPDLPPTYPRPTPDLPSASVDNHSKSAPRARDQNRGEEKRREEKRADQIASDRPSAPSAEEPLALTPHFGPTHEPEPDPPKGPGGLERAPVEPPENLEPDPIPDPPPTDQVPKAPPSSVAGPSVDAELWGGVVGADDPAKRLLLASTHAELVEQFRLRYDHLTGGGCWAGVQGRPALALVNAILATAAKHGLEPAEVIRSSLDAWFADAYVKRSRYRWNLCKSQLLEFFTPPQRPESWDDHDVPEHLDPDGGAVNLPARAASNGASP